MGKRRLSESVAWTPGVLLCVAVSAAAWLLQGLETRLFGRAWLESIVLAIVVGAVVRTLWTPGKAWRSGIDFSAKTVLEIAIVLLGATLSMRTIASLGAGLVFAVVGLVMLAVPAGYIMARVLGLPRRMAILIACGNAICGNSAIAAVAPVIGAESEDVTASIAFTAVLGVVVVLLLPVLAALLRLNDRAFGVYAGLTVYAVPQVLAATAPVSRLSTQIGALVKLVRVLMLGPVVTVLSILGLGRPPRAPGSDAAGGRRLSPTRLFPWFIAGFLVLAGVGSSGLLPHAGVHAAGAAASGLTVVSMAALGLGVDVRALAKAGPRVSAAVTLSLTVLGLLAFSALWLLGLA